MILKIFLVKLTFLAITCQTWGQGYRGGYSSGGYSGGGGGGYNYPVPGNPLQYPDPSTSYGAPDKDSDLSQNSTATTTTEEEEKAEGEDDSATSDKNEDEAAEGDGEPGITAEDALNRAGNIEGIQDFGDRVNNDIITEDVVEERQRFIDDEEELKGALEERFVDVEGGVDGDSGASSSLTRRRATLSKAKNKDKTKRTKNRTSSTNIRETFQSKLNREIASKPNVSKKSSGASGSRVRSYAADDDDNDDVIITRRKAKKGLASNFSDEEADDNEAFEEGGTFAASNPDPIFVNRKRSKVRRRNTKVVSSGRTYRRDNKGSGSNLRYSLIRISEVPRTRKYYRVTYFGDELSPSSSVRLVRTLGRRVG